ncbi:TetR/AcrR family transcriptional regulator [Actinomycetospora straminea]|uniref:TetR/AcrR family transcriptional regulator n=1 Tax=Actinomycetospora straminea TaxID=663607 RepID=A0ABP9ESU6_9PSEU|nr:TetR/AcrR family transcriptional regulator [Actinomycetospora straminea]MDD7933120.1 TetR/AcrR family transcriptional regulator [Actinomycetospora straminea]
MALRQAHRRARVVGATIDQPSAELWGPEFAEVAQRLLSSAVLCFARNGFHATTTRDITAGVGLSPGALYVHFSTKEDVLFAITRVGHERALAGLGDDTDELEPAEQVAELVRRFVAWHARHHTVARICQYELSGLEPEHFEQVQHLRQQINQVFRGAVARGVRAGLFDVPDVHRAARVIISLGVDLVRWYRLDGPDSPKALADEYAELALRMVLARPGG